MAIGAELGRVPVVCFQIPCPHEITNTSMHKMTRGAWPGFLSLFIEDIEAVIEKMSILAEMGIKFSIDDFGTGYSSLSYLKRLPVHELKIDKSFIQDAPVNSGDAALVETMISFASHMGIRIVAEGVENQDHANFLKPHPGVIQQGFLHGTPEPADKWFELNISH